MTTAMLSRTYDEAMSLLVETRNYLSFRRQVDDVRIEPMDRLKLTRESFRLTSRLAQVMAWLMLRRAVVEGEIADDEARQPEHRLAGHDATREAAPPRLETRELGLGTQHLAL